MSAPPPHHRGAHPKTMTPAPKVRYACVACAFEYFQTAHSLRRHMIRVQNFSCDFPRTVFPDDWAVSHREDVNPEAVPDRPPFCH